MEKRTEELERTDKVHWSKSGYWTLVLVGLLDRSTGPGRDSGHWSKSGYWTLVLVGLLDRSTGPGRDSGHWSR